MEAVRAVRQVEADSHPDMTNVVSLDNYRPHRSGMACCLNCKNEWAAVAPIGTVALECPECRTMQGIYVGLAATEFKQWQCQCDSFVFFIDEHGAYCSHCGTRPVRS